MPNCDAICRDLDNAGTFRACPSQLSRVSEGVDERDSLHGQGLSGRGASRRAHESVYSFSGPPSDVPRRASIASNSKLFTALAVGLLIHRRTPLKDESVLDWSTRIQTVLPGLLLRDATATSLADIIDLMSEVVDHIVADGVPRYENGTSIARLFPRVDSETRKRSQGADGHRAVRPDAWVAYLRTLRPSAPFRGAFQYNNAHYATLSEIVPALTGTSFLDFSQESILDPLGMDEKYYSAHVAQRSGKRSHAFFRAGHHPSRGKARWKTTGEIDPALFHGKTVSIGWWTDGDCIHEAVPGAIVMSGKDMVNSGHFVTPVHS